MKLQEASKKEIKRITLGSAVLLVLMLAAFYVLSLVGVGTFGWRTVVSGLIGTVLEILSFAILCLTVQSVAGMENGKPMKARVQLGYNLRLFLQAGWVVVAFVIPVFQVLPAAIPLLFPTVILWYLQLKGKLVTPSERTDVPQKDVPEEDRLDSFEA
ncbi:MAG: ATP synthase subunit I [Oscillospiraceae bacterium]|nr:ATP synthase subunit I [Oscillospiraceae bacterium]